MFHNASPLTLVALATWGVTATLGGNLLVRGRAYRLFTYAMADRELAGQRPPVVRAVLMGLHFLFAVSGLIFWVGYSMFDRRVLAYGALILLGAVALLGMSVADRWRNGSGRHARQEGDGRGFPVWSATIHVMAATTTIVLVALITVLHIGE